MDVEQAKATDAHYTHKPPEVLGLLNYLTHILRTRAVIDIH